MDHIDKEYRHFQEDLNENDVIQSYLSRIDVWEHESINKIHKTAEIARNDLLEIVNRMKNQFKASFEKINHDIQLNRESQSYTEINLNQWMVQLKQLRDIYNTLLTDDIIGDSQSSIHLIKIIDKKQSFSIEKSRFLPHEKFDKIAGEITLSQDLLTATCSGNHWNGSTISGSNLYSSGVHSIRFRVTKKGKMNLFFGITSSAEESNPWNRKTPFAYGWWDIPLSDEKKQEEIKDPDIQTGDEVTLTLDCLSNQIDFEHHRTNRFISETISNERCPFPWKIAIVLYSPGDSVSILS
jgi:hypothetical protein